MAKIRLGYCREKLSLAVFEMCVSTVGLKGRLRGALRCGFLAFPEETFPEEVREQFCEIRAELNGARSILRLEDYPDSIDRMTAAQAKRLIDKFISLREGASKAYYKRQ